MATYPLTRPIGEIKHVARPDGVAAQIAEICRLWEVTGEQMPADLARAANAAGQQSVEESRARLAQTERRLRDTMLQLADQLHTLRVGADSVGSKALQQFEQKLRTAAGAR